MKGTVAAAPPLYTAGGLGKKLVVQGQGREHPSSSTPAPPVLSNNLPEYDGEHVGFAG